MLQRLILPRPLAVCAAAAIRDREAQSAPPLLPGGSDRRQRKQMSRAAWLSALVLRRVLAQAGWDGGEKTAQKAIGAFLGVGSSGAELEELAALLAGSISDGQFSLQRFGECGIYAVNPLLAFQLMNNFTLCHGAILCGLGGPNSAFFSRGAGTVAALFTAAWSILDGDCAQAVAGGADSALHPVTLCELRRAGALAAGLKPGEGAAVIAIAVTAGDAGDAGGAELVACGVVPGAEAAGTFDARSLLCAVDPAALEPALSCVLTSEVAAGVDAVVTSGAVLPLRQLLQEQVRRHLPAARHFDMTDLEDGATETLAAAPALAWCAALKQLQAGAAAKLLVLSAGIDGDLGVVGLKRSR